MIRVLENEFYYLDNFQRVLDWIAQRYADLLDGEEQAFIQGFAQLPRPSQALFVRMVMRKGSLFRASKMNYPEIGCPVAASRDLLPTGWIVCDPVLGIDELFELLVKPEIAEAFALAAPLKSARKPEQLEALREQAGEARPFSQWYPGCPDTVFAIGVKPLCDRLRLLFFGNLHQDWTEFVLSDLGLFRYEQVEFSDASRGFRSRQDIEHYLQLHACRERFHELEPGCEHMREVLQEVLREIPRHSFGNDWLDSRRERLLFRHRTAAREGQGLGRRPRRVCRMPLPRRPLARDAGVREGREIRPGLCAVLRRKRSAGERGRAPAPAAHRPAPGA
jgi:hypothetical protein